jgi:hypothetical protein
MAATSGTHQSLQREVAQELDRRVAVMQILADSPELKAWNLPAFCQLIRSLRDRDPVVLVTREKLIATSRTPDCSVSQVSNRVRNAFSEGAVILSDPFRGKQDNTPIITLNMPVQGGGHPRKMACHRLAQDSSFLFKPFRCRDCK